MLGIQKIRVTHFIAIFALLLWSGTKFTISLRYACIVRHLKDLAEQLGGKKWLVQKDKAKQKQKQAKNPQLLTSEKIKGCTRKKK